VGAVLAGQAPPAGPARARDAAESDTEALLREAGLAPDAIETLRRDGVVA
jgi:hypothetical protein